MCIQVLAIALGKSSSHFYNYNLEDWRVPAIAKTRGDGRWEGRQCPEKRKRKIFQG